ncbi:MAG: hypothetical protein AAF939_12170 [Planctomycetota bacterium]
MPFIGGNFRIPTAFLPLFAVLTVTTVSVAQDAMLKQAMDIKPKQVVEYEQPGIAVLKECEFKKTKVPPGFLVQHKTGRLLRKYVDSNSDGKLDVWSYYQNGQEVYRDVDKNFDGKTDQYRWLGEAGTRWGIDSNQDGVIDAWKVISAEEVAYEAFEAFRTRDQDRFDRLLITPTEFAGLQLSSAVAKEVQKRWQNAKTNFLSSVRSQSEISTSSKWVYAGNGWPSMIPAGDIAKTNIVVYNHGAGFFESKGNETAQLALGTLVKIGEVWRMIELPEVYDGKALRTGGAFFPSDDMLVAGGMDSGADRNLASLYDELAKIEELLNKATGTNAQKLELKKCEILAKFVENTKDAQTKTQWVETLADSASSAYQTDRFNDGVKFLENIEKTKSSWPALDYVGWRAIFAEYGWMVANGDREQRDDAQDKLNSKLVSFVKKYPKSQFAGDALIQLGISYEVNEPDKPSKALEWYRQCAAKYPNTKFGKRAAGAIVRLNSQGKTFPFKGKTVDGKTFDLRSKTGKIVILHFWQTWCDDGIDELAKLADKYKDDLVIVSCNIETEIGENGIDKEQATEKYRTYMSSNRSSMPWIQLHEPGGVEESGLAFQLGVSSEPMVALVDRKGRLVETNIAFGALDREIELERRRKN